MKYSRIQAPWKSSVQRADATALLGMQTPGAWLLVGYYIAANVLVTFTSMDGVRNLAPIVLALVASAVGMIGLIVIPGDPLPHRAAAAMMALVPVNCALVLPVLSIPIENSLQTSFLGPLTLICAFLCVRGRTAFALGGLALMIASCMIWSSATGQGATYGLSLSAINAGPVLMATFFAITLRPLARSIFDLRAQNTARVAAEAAAAAVLEERDAQLNRLDDLARPMLERIASGGAFTEEEALTCRLLEAQLRDTLRAPGLADQTVGRAARSARCRGVEVVLLDDKGSDDLDAARRATFVAEIADRLDGVGSGLVTIRILPPHRERLATMLVSDASGVKRTEFDRDGNAVVDAQ